MVIGRLLLSSVAAVLLLASEAGHADPAQDSHWAALAARLFPLLSAASTPQEGNATVRSGPGGELRTERKRRIDVCQQVPKCLVDALQWSDPEREREASVIESLLANHPMTRDLVPDDGVRAEVLRELHGLNVILQTYGQGTTPRYPKIDGPGASANQPAFATALVDAEALSNAGQNDPATMLDPSIGLALALLDVNGADEAAAFEPLDTRFNAGAIARARTIDWSRYRYTAIIVPGIGPNDLTTPLSAKGKLNVRLAALRFSEGVAPFILVSGGQVHPRGTHYAEAMEMRRALIERFGIPSDCIVVDPYARHTTTNLRNAVRRLAALNAPLDRDALIVSNAEQLHYIEGPEFSSRNAQELGYQPGLVNARSSRNELDFRPSRMSMRSDPGDPLDP